MEVLIDASICYLTYLYYSTSSSLRSYHLQFKIQCLTWTAFWYRCTIWFDLSPERVTYDLTRNALLAAASSMHSNNDYGLAIKHMCVCGVPWPVHRGA